MTIQAPGEPLLDNESTRGDERVSISGMRWCMWAFPEYPLEEWEAVKKGQEEKGLKIWTPWMRPHGEDVWLYLLWLSIPR